MNDTPTREQFIENLARGYLPMDVRNSSAVIDERVNQLATTVTVRREQQLGTDFMLRLFGGHSD